MLTTEVQAQFMQSTIPSLPAIAGNVVAWICEFCDSKWPQLQKKCGSRKRWKGGKGACLIKKDNQEQTVSKDKEKKGVGKVKRCLLYQPPGGGYSFGSRQCIMQPIDRRNQCQ